MLSWGKTAVVPAPDRANPARSQEIYSLAAMPERGEDDARYRLEESAFRRLRRLAAGSAVLLRAVLRQGATRSGTGDVNVAGRDRGPAESRRKPDRAFRSR
jgi:hypothetical protein